MAAVTFGLLASGLSWLGCGRDDIGGGKGKLYFVGELPCEDGRGVFVSVDDFTHVVLEGVDDGRVGIEFCL